MSKTADRTAETTNKVNYYLDCECLIHGGNNTCQTIPDPRKVI